MDAMVVIGKQVRVVIPVEIRVQLGLAAGDPLYLHTAGTRSETGAALRWPCAAIPPRILAADRAWTEIDLPIHVQLIL
jgi:AbrB family looped-hinge helix DNA binding protein